MNCRPVALARRRRASPEIAHAGHLCLQQRRAFSDRSWLAKTRVVAPGAGRGSPSRPRSRRSRGVAGQPGDLYRSSPVGEPHSKRLRSPTPQLYSGIGNAYSDEILFAARLSPTALTKKLTASEIERLFNAVRDQLLKWTDRLRADAGDKFPEKVTAFRPRWRYMAATSSRVPGAAGRYSAFVTLRMKPTTALIARPAASCSPTEASRGSCARTGRKLRRARKPHRDSPQEEHLSRENQDYRIRDKARRISDIPTQRSALRNRYPLRGLSSFATTPVHPVWCEAPTPRPLSPSKYS